jgi:hypothetical protein
MSHIVEKDGLPQFWPTNRHAPEFWEALGRTVASFGFLEEVLGKAIFVFTGTRPYPKDEVAEAYERWLPTLERAMSDALSNLIDVYVKSVKQNPSATIQNLQDLEADLRKAARV